MLTKATLYEVENTYATSIYMYNNCPNKQRPFKTFDLEAGLIKKKKVYMMLHLLIMHVSLCKFTLSRLVKLLN